MGAKRWNELEDAVLADVAERKAQMREHMHLLPGRTYYAALQRAQSLGIVFRLKAWSPQEIAILKRIYASNESIKHAAARELPDRTYPMVKSEAQRLGICAPKRMPRGYGYSAVFRGVERLLAPDEDGTAPMMSVAEIAAELRVASESVRSALKRQHGKRVRVADFGRAGGGGRAQLWALGSGPDAVRPPRKTNSEASRQYRERRRIRGGTFNPFAGLAVTIQPWVVG